MVQVMVMENTNPLVGSCGTVSWQLVEINMRLIIMWSVPFNFNIRDSYYAIGLTHNKVSNITAVNGLVLAWGLWLVKCGKPPYL